MSTNNNRITAEIWTEGKTDWKILKKAKDILGLNLPIVFHESNKDMGDDKLLGMLQTYAQRSNPEPLIFVFDHDDPRLMLQISDVDKRYKSWGNNVYSFAIPIPKHRIDQEYVSIEMYFTNDELHKKDDMGRRLFLSSEFVERSGNHIVDPTIHLAQPGVIKNLSDSNKIKIIDSNVYDRDSNNIALSKADFADYVRRGEKPFDELDFSQFALIFDIVQEIIELTRPRYNIFIPDTFSFFEELKSKEPPKQFQEAFNLVVNTISLALYIFSISTIRVYENQIVDESTEYRKKVLPIYKIISEAFRQPSLSILTNLARYCFYLVDSKAPAQLKEMKQCLAQTISLGEIGKMLDDFDLLVPKPYGERRKRADYQWELLEKTIPAFAEIAGKDQINLAFNNVTDYSEIKLDTWKRAQEKIRGYLKPIFIYPFVLRSIKNYDMLQGQYTIEIRLFEKDTIEYREEKFFSDTDDITTSTSEIIFDLPRSIYPFLLIHNDALFFYRRTISLGYEYYSPLLRKTYIEKTKTKFSNAIFFTRRSKQELFWTDVLPSQHPVSGIRANIPETSGEFVGRQGIIKQIKEEIIEIINENGIIYGPGGIGKTALLIKLSNDLFEESNKENILYNNIIWVSAKNDYYDYIQDNIESRAPQVNSFGNIISAILLFFDIENLDGYSLEDRKELVISVFKEHKTLLVLDNFETLNRNEQSKILEFFSTTLKRALRNMPANFKILLTSRELVPAGFNQIELAGLGYGETKRLIENICKKYNTNIKLADPQQEILYKATRGIPLLLNHYMARIYEYSEPFDSVLQSLPNYSSKIVQFSFKEILTKIEGEKDQVGLKILLLLEFVSRPLMLRQIAEILELEEPPIATKLQTLSDFECVKRLFQNNSEKYCLNDDIDLLAKSLIREHQGIYQNIRTLYYQNLPLVQQLDYSFEEEILANTFESLLKSGLKVEAEDFIRKELRNRKNSILLNYYYAIYLRVQLGKIDEAISSLEGIREPGQNNPAILQQLFLCYATQENPDFEKANDLLSQIQAEIKETLDYDFKLEIAKFFVRWFTTIKQAKSIDRFDDNKRIFEYKNLANRALGILAALENELYNPKHDPAIDNLDKVDIFFLLAQTHYALWDYVSSLRAINKATDIAVKEHAAYPIHKLALIRNFKSTVQDTMTFYKKNTWAKNK